MSYWSLKCPNCGSIVLGLRKINGINETFCWECQQYGPESAFLHKTPQNQKEKERT